MRYLVINNNLPDLIVEKGDTDSIPFDPQRIVGESYNYEVDIYQSLKQIIGDDKYNAFIVSVNLDKNNNLEFDGLDIAYTLRLSPDLKHQYIPIIFLGSLSLEQVLRLNPKANILLTKGVFYLLLNNASIENIDKLKLRDITPEEYIEFIERINVPTPGNYQTHHSVANEWALIRYFSMIDNDEKDDKYVTLKRKIADLDYFNTLHFKYSEALIARQKFNLKKNEPLKIINDVRDKKIGVIDDESIKGWGAFYDYWFSKSGAEMVLFEKFEKGKSKKSLINDIKTWIDNQKAIGSVCDAYIIDLRLHDDDFYSTDVDNLSGIQVAEYLKKKINPGIQIVISTASNKVWNYQKCIEIGIPSFVVKESPETNNTKEETRISLVYFSKQISNAIQKSYLSSIYSVISDLKIENVFSNASSSIEFNDIVFSSNGLLDQIFHLLNLDDRKDSVLNQCLLLCFQVLENYCDHPLVGNFPKPNNSRTSHSGGCIFDRDGLQKEIFLWQPNDMMLSTWFELKFSKFSFQNEESSDTPVDFELFERRQMVMNNRTGLESTFLVKMISVLVFRNSINNVDVKRLMKLRYYRSNVAAHLTGNVNLDKFKLRSDDIRFFISIFVKLFK